MLDAAQGSFAFCAKQRLRERKGQARFIAGISGKKFALNSGMLTAITEMEPHGPERCALAGKTEGNQTRKPSFTLVLKAPFFLGKKASPNKEPDLLLPSLTSKHPKPCAGNDSMHWHFDDATQRDDQTASASQPATRLLEGTNHSAHPFLVRMSGPRSTYTQKALAFLHANRNDNDSYSKKKAPLMAFSSKEPVAIALLAIAANAHSSTAESSNAGAIEELVVKGRALYSDQVNALKTPTPILNVPQSLSLFTAEKVRDRGNSIGEIIAYMPGVHMSQGEGHRDAVV